MDNSSNANEASCCCTASSDRFVVACSGAANVGQISNALAVKMNQQGVARMTCLTALGAHLPAYIESVRDTELVVLDGCPVACAKQVIEHIGIKDYKYFVISEMGVKKTRRFDQVENDTEQVWEKIINQL
jgi:uncharacterized metal-binding protein